MSVFDNVKCHYQTPWPEAAGLYWQTRDTDAQFLDIYEIRDDGTLWYQAYDSQTVVDADAPCGFVLKKSNYRWERVPWEGELEIHSGPDHPGWYSVRFWFRDGKIKDAIYHKSDKAT